MENRLQFSHNQGIAFRKTCEILTGSDLSLTPLVDVVFLLLIFFMMSSSLIFQPGITVNLPETRQELESVADKLIITLTKEKLLFFNDQRLEDWNHLEQRLANIAYNRDTEANSSVDSKNGYRLPIIILKADKDLPYNDIVKIMSVTRRYGLSVFLVTQTDHSRRAQ